MFMVAIALIWLDHALGSFSPFGLRRDGSGLAGLRPRWPGRRCRSLNANTSSESGRATRRN